MEFLGNLLTGVVAGTITAFLLLFVMAVFAIHKRIMKK